LRHRPEKKQAAVKKAQAAFKKSRKPRKKGSRRQTTTLFFGSGLKKQASVKNEQASVEKDARCALVSNRRSLRSRREQTLAALSSRTESAKRRTKRFYGGSPLAFLISGAANPRRARRSASPSAQNKKGGVRTKERGSRKKVLLKKNKRTRFSKRLSKKGRGFGLGPRLQKKAGSLGRKGAEYKQRRFFEAPAKTTGRSQKEPQNHRLRSKKRRPLEKRPEASEGREPNTKQRHVFEAPA